LDTPVVFLPHPMFRISSGVREKCWRFCFSEPQEC
jgi:hypothetical protein